MQSRCLRDAVTCFYMTNAQRPTHNLNSSVSISPNLRTVASKAVREYDFGLGGGCIMAALLAIVPLRLACTMAHRLGKVRGGFRRAQSV
jgi:hypothetical protein